MIRIEVRASVPYTTLAAQASALLEREPFTIDAGLVRGALHVRDVVVRPSGEQLTVAASVRATLAWPLPHVRGVVEVSATPVYDGEAQRLRLRDVSVVGAVDPVLARAVLAVTRRRIVDALSDFALDLEPVLRDLRDRLNASLSGHGVAPKVALHGRIGALRVDDVLLEEALVVVASASGQLDLVFAPPVRD